MIDTAETAAYIVTPIVLLLLLAAPFAGYLRILTRLTGSEPLRPDPAPRGDHANAIETRPATAHAADELPPAPTGKTAVADGGGEQ